MDSETASKESPDVPAGKASGDLPVGTEEQGKEQ